MTIEADYCFPERNTSRGSLATLLVYLIIYGCLAAGGTDATWSLLYLFAGMLTVLAKIVMPAQRQGSTVKKQIYFALRHVDLVLFWDLPLWPFTALLLLLCSRYSYEEEDRNDIEFCLRENDRSIPTRAVYECAARSMKNRNDSAKKFEENLDEAVLPVAYAAARTTFATAISVAGCAHPVAAAEKNDPATVGITAFSDVHDGDRQINFAFNTGRFAAFIQNYQSLDRKTGLTAATAGMRFRLPVQSQVSLMAGPQFNYINGLTDRITAFAILKPVTGLTLFNRLSWGLAGQPFADRHVITWTLPVSSGSLFADCEILRTKDGVKDRYAGIGVIPFKRRILRGFSVLTYYDWGRGGAGIRVSYAAKIRLRR